MQAERSKALPGVAAASAPKPGVAEPRRIEVSDPRADGRRRVVLLARDRVVIARSVGGVFMHIAMTPNAYRGVVLRMSALRDGVFHYQIQLAHRDADLSVTLLEASDDSEARAEWRLWARFLGLPWRSSNATASNIPDAQSVYESQMSLWGALFGGCNFVLHAAGWLESGLTTSYEKFILDIEMLQMFAEVFQPVGAAPSDLALEAVAEVGAGGHFFGCAHTMERYRSAFYAPLVSDWRNSGSWADDGAKTATERATGIWQSTLQHYVAPPRDPAVVEALDAYVARRKEEGGAPPIT